MECVTAWKTISQIDTVVMQVWIRKLYKKNGYIAQGPTQPTILRSQNVPPKP